MFQDPKSFSTSVPITREQLSGRTPDPTPPPAPGPKPAPAIRPLPEPRPALVTDLHPAPRVDLARALGVDLGFILRSKRLIAMSISAALAACLIFYVTASPRYRAVVQILISPVDLRVLDKSLVQNVQTSDANVIQVESETRVLTSDKVLRRVVESEKLAADPEFGGSSVSWLGAIIPAVRASIGLDGGVYQKEASELGALRTLQRATNAKRTERTYVIDLTVDANEPYKSARIANAVAGAYLEEQTFARTEAARRVTESLSARLTELQARVRRAEEAVEGFKSQHNIVGAGGRLVHEQQLGDLNNQLSAAKARTAEARARYDRTLQRGGTDAGSTSEAVQSNTIGRLREQHATVARQEATLSAELGPRHPFVIEARAQVRNVERLISDEIGRLAVANRIDYERALANENALSRNLDTLKQSAMDTNLAFVKLRELVREVEASRAVYESFLVRSRETREQEQLDNANVRILSDAQPARDRFWPPRLILLLLAGLFIGTLGGVAMAYLADQFRRAPRPFEIAALPKQALR